MTKQETIDKIISYGNRFHRFRVGQPSEKYEFLAFMDCPFCVDQETKRGQWASSSIFLTNKGNFLFKGLPKSPCDCHIYSDDWFTVAEQLPVLQERKANNNSNKWKAMPKAIKGDEEVSKSDQVSEDEETMTDQELLNEFRKLCAEGKVNWNNINNFDKEYPHIGLNTFSQILSEEHEKNEKEKSAKFANLGR